MIGIQPHREIAQPTSPNIFVSSRATHPFSESTCFPIELTRHLPVVDFSCHECGLGQYMPERAPGCVAGERFYLQYQLVPGRQERVDVCRGGCIDCPPGWTDLDLGVCTWLPSDLSCGSCSVPPFAFRDRFLNSVLAFADPDTPCVRCGANTYAPVPATRGQCELCSDVPNSQTVVDADVRPRPSAFAPVRTLPLFASVLTCEFVGSQHNASTPCAHVQSDIVFSSGQEAENHPGDGGR